MAARPLPDSLIKQKDDGDGKDFSQCQVARCESRWSLVLREATFLPVPPALWTVTFVTRGKDASFGKSLVISKYTFCLLDKCS